MTERLGGDKTPPALAKLTRGDLAYMAIRAHDAWAVLRCVPANEGEAALRRHGIKLEEHDGGERFSGTRDALAEDIAAIESLLHRIASELGR